jgi:hypothetical protein
VGDLLAKGEVLKYPKRAVTDILFPTGAILSFIDLFLFACAEIGTEIAASGR